jgi:hypothetical protein
MTQHYEEVTVMIHVEQSLAVNEAFLAKLKAALKRDITLLSMATATKPRTAYSILPQRAIKTNSASQTTQPSSQKLLLLTTMTSCMVTRGGSKQSVLCANTSGSPHLCKTAMTMSAAAIHAKLINTATRRSKDSCNPSMTLQTILKLSQWIL